VEIKSKGGNREPPLRVAIDTLFFYSVEKFAFSD